MTDKIQGNADPLWKEPRVIALLMAASLTTMANATISPALPGLESLFANHPRAELLTRLLVPAPSLTVAIFAPIAGWLADRSGRRWLLMTGVLLFVVTGSAGLYLPGLSAIFASRLVQGIAVAMIMTAQTALIGDYFSGAHRTAVTGLQTSARNFGGLVFIVLAGWLATMMPRLAFAVYGIALVFLPLIWSAIDEPDRKMASGRSEKTAASDGHPAWIMLMTTLVLLQAATNLVFFLMPTQLPFFFESLGYTNALMTGAALGALTLAGGCVALLYGRISATTGYSGTFALGFGAMSAGFAMLSLGTVSVATFVGTMAVGIGFALVMPNFVAIALSVTPAQRRGLAGGLLTTAVFLGQFCSPFLSTPSIGLFGFGITFAGAAALLAAFSLAAVVSRLAGACPGAGEQLG